MNVAHANSIHLCNAETISNTPPKKKKKHIRLRVSIHIVWYNFSRKQKEMKMIKGRPINVKWNISFQYTPHSNKQNLYIYDRLRTKERWIKFVHGDKLCGKNQMEIYLRQKKRVHSEFRSSFKFTFAPPIV